MTTAAETKQTTQAQQHFAQLLEQHRGIVLKVTTTYCWHPDDRSELNQEIFTQLWRAFSKYDQKLNVAISFVRNNSLRQRHFVVLDEAVHDIANPTEQHDDDIDFLYRFIDQLDPLNRALLLLYLEQRNHQEIADILGISKSNVATKINRLKQRIRDASQASSEQHRSTRNDRNSKHGTR